MDLTFALADRQQRRTALPVTLKSSYNFLNNLLPHTQREKGWKMEMEEGKWSLAKWKWKWC